MKALCCVCILFFSAGCYEYRVLNTNIDPATEYRDSILHSYAWGLIRKPKDFHVPNCSINNALDEVVFEKNAGRSLITLATFGFVSTVRVRWKCHKPYSRTDSL